MSAFTSYTKHSDCSCIVHMQRCQYYIISISYLMKQMIRFRQTIHFCCCSNEVFSRQYFWPFSRPLVAWEHPQKQQFHKASNTIPSHGHLAVVLLVEAGAGLREQRALQERVSKAGDDLVKVPAHTASGWTHWSGQDKAYYYPILPSIHISTMQTWHPRVVLCVISPFKVFKTLEGHHGPHALTGGRECPF